MYRIQIKDMDLEQIAKSGQCFRIRKREEDNHIWAITASEDYVEAVKEGDSFLFSCSETEFNRKWWGYFDLQTDYSRLKKQVDPSDSYLKDAMNQGWGVRILRQDLWEMLITFLISQNNNISRITKSVEELCRHFGDTRTGTGIRKNDEGIFEEIKITYQTFPQPEQIAQAGISALAGLGLGYRDKYIYSMAETCSEKQGKEWLAMLAISDYKTAHAMLLKQYGIGKKVADCVCLFGLHHVGAFPVDTHVRQILETHYPSGFPLKEYDGYAGILQQYMFYYKLNKRIKKENIPL